MPTVQWVILVCSVLPAMPVLPVLLVPTGLPSEEVVVMEAMVSTRQHRHGTAEMVAPAATAATVWKGSPGTVVPVVMQAPVIRARAGLAKAVQMEAMAVPVARAATVLQALAARAVAVAMRDPVGTAVRAALAAMGVMVVPPAWVARVVTGVQPG